MADRCGAFSMVLVLIVLFEVMWMIVAGLFHGSGVDCSF